LADLVFVGGSFNARGGQNPIEAARFKKPVLHGPNVSNFREVYRKLDEAGGAFCAPTENELFEQSKLLFSDVKLRIEAGAHAYSVIREMSGATDRALDYLSAWIQLNKSKNSKVKRQKLGIK
jgi:3-deoxy-D-manno-octulosonic-acid transferase